MYDLWEKTIDALSGVGRVGVFIVKVLSLGAGVQSTTLLLMACKGEIEKPDVAIFADTGWESKKTYKHLAWLKGEAERNGIPVVTVNERNIRDDSLNATELNGGFYFMPLHLDKSGVHLMGKRQCTDRYKLRPIFHKIRELLDVSRKARLPKDSVEMWIGISLDECKRMSLSPSKWVGKRYPLVERMMSRNDCIKWLHENYNGLSVAKSSCIGCPYHDTTTWQEIYAEPDEWADAILVDEAIRHGSKKAVGYSQYLHRLLIPLRDVDLRTPEDKGQLPFDFYKQERIKLFATTKPLWVPS